MTATNKISFVISGQCATYAVVDANAKTVLAAGSWVGMGQRGRELLATYKGELALRNLSHSMCPAWLRAAGGTLSAFSLTGTLTANGNDYVLFLHSNHWYEWTV